jgi:hypothetical protein
LDRRLDGPQFWTGHCGEEKNSQLLSGLEPSIIQSVAQRYATDLYLFIVPESRLQLFLKPVFL